MDHGPISPAATTPVRSCPNCGQIAYRVIADKTLGQSYAPDSPTHCTAGHELKARTVHLGYDHCRAHHHHRSWRCEECGDLLSWPPRDEQCPTGIGMGPPSG